MSNFNLCVMKNSEALILWNELLYEMRRRFLSLGWSFEFLSARCGIAPANLRRIFDGRCKCSSVAFLAVARSLGFSVRLLADLPMEG